MAVAVLDLNEAACAGNREGDQRRGRSSARGGRRRQRTDQVDAAVERVAAELGPPTVLVDNAGVIRDNLLFKMTDGGLGHGARRAPARRVPETRAAQKYMVEQRYGRIINLSSSLGAG